MVRILVAILFALASITTLAAAQYSVAGSDGAPTMGTCGTTPSVSGTDQMGVITVGTGTVTSCAMNFSATMSVTPSCVISSSSTSHYSISGLTTTVLTVTFAASSPGAKIYYRCGLK